MKQTSEALRAQRFTKNNIGNFLVFLSALSASVVRLISIFTSMIKTAGVKKYLLALLCLVCLSAFGQKDTAKYGYGNVVDTTTHSFHCLVFNPDDCLKHQLTIKINPGLLISEQGLSIQYNLTYNFGILLGGGYNEDNSGNTGFHTYDGSGYTIRAGILQYLDPVQKWYFSFQGFYRYYGNLNAVAQDAQGFTQGIDDQVINPLRQNLNNVAAGDGDQVDVYHAHARIICVDAVWGYQLRKRHFVLDMFGGFGSREKEIYLQEVGYYINAIGNVGNEILFNNVRSKTVFGEYLDVKLGFTLGYRFY